MTLAGYIGALGKADNTKVQGEGHENIAMTSPVITQEQSKGESEKIAMTAPVITCEFLLKSGVKGKWIVKL